MPRLECGRRVLSSIRQSPITALASRNESNRLPLSDSSGARPLKLCRRRFIVKSILPNMDNRTLTPRGQHRRVQVKPSGFAVEASQHDFRDRVRSSVSAARPESRETKVPSRWEGRAAAQRATSNPSCRSASSGFASVRARSGRTALRPGGSRRSGAHRARREVRRGVQRDLRHHPGEVNHPSIRAPSAADRALAQRRDASKRRALG